VFHAPLLLRLAFFLGLSASCTRRYRQLTSVAATLPGMVLPANCPTQDAGAIPNGPCNAPFLPAGTFTGQNFDVPQSLRFAEEPSLFDIADHDVEVYRVVWVRHAEPARGGAAASTARSGASKAHAPATTTSSSAGRRTRKHFSRSA
jgi:hypothetical protein